MVSDFEILKQSDIFTVIKNGELKKIYQIMEKRKVLEGEKLAMAGEKASFFFFLISGVLLLSMEKGKSVIIEKPGDFIGFQILSSKGVYRNSLISLAKGKVFAVNRKAFLEIVQADSYSALNITRAWHNYITRKIPFADYAQHHVDFFDFTAF